MSNTREIYNNLLDELKAFSEEHQENHLFKDKAWEFPTHPAHLLGACDTDLEESEGNLLEELKKLDEQRKKIGIENGITYDEWKVLVEKALKEEFRRIQLTIKQSYRTDITFAKAQQGYRKRMEQGDSRKKSKPPHLSENSDQLSNQDANQNDVNLLMAYFEVLRSLEKKLNSNAQYAKVSEYLKKYQVAFSISQEIPRGLTYTDAIKAQLTQQIYRRIPAEKLYTLLQPAYDQLLLGYNEYLDIQSAFKRNLPGYFKTLVLDYSSIEEKESEKKAKKDTWLFCAFIVTIFFYKLFYNFRLQKYRQNQYFQTLLVGDRLTQPANTQTINKALKEHQLYPVGLEEKVKHHISPSSKEAIFSKKNNVRKILLSSNSQCGMRLLGSKKQIQDAQEKHKVPAVKKRW